MSGTIDIEALCAAKGLRITEQRRTIARVLSAAVDHPDVEELHRRAVGAGPAHLDRDGVPHGAGCSRRQASSRATTSRAAGRATRRRATRTTTI